MLIKLMYVFNIIMKKICVIQSITTLWKGIGSSLMVKGLAVATETTIHEFTPLPRLFAVLLE
jgi:hypothetical protein